MFLSPLLSGLLKLIHPSQPPTQSWNAKRTSFAIGYIYMYKNNNTQCKNSLRFVFEKIELAVQYSVLLDLHQVC